ncbi:uncharacterized protein BX663DRAFT_129912 [Cokeromyces recurvatus]|uniref:uncharacterized protein n=1 Tax=Cokeromyces recurvatus TaxID=90255 RepID=UPI00221FD340|nr:uncharacterized protein BX663DRAFT_129912 [Cokeromyces recurvatus]KAI7907151.1 hypothetical protein BX663DRAFT_129912 [Cokeromyces recurvatus]
MFVLILIYFLIPVIAGQQQIVLQSLHRPFTMEWIQLLEYLHNTFGNHSKDDSICLFPIPAFECKPFIWNDGIIKRDAYHLRPNDIKSVVAIGDSISAGFGMISGYIYEECLIIIILLQLT